MCIWHHNIVLRCARPMAVMFECATCLSVLQVCTFDGVAALAAYMQIRWARRAVQQYPPYDRALTCVCMGVTELACGDLCVLHAAVSNQVFPARQARGRQSLRHSPSGRCGQALSSRQQSHGRRQYRAARIVGSKAYECCQRDRDQFFIPSCRSSAVFLP